LHSHNTQLIIADSGPCNQSDTPGYANQNTS
jgi:hypothetical protein